MRPKRVRYKSDEARCNCDEGSKRFIPSLGSQRLHCFDPVSIEGQIKHSWIDRRLIYAPAYCEPSNRVGQGQLNHNTADEAHRPHWHWTRSVIDPTG